MSVWQKIKAWFNPCDTTSEVISQAAYKNAAKAATAVVQPRAASPSTRVRAKKTPNVKLTRTSTSTPINTSRGTATTTDPNDWLTNTLHPLNPLNTTIYTDTSGPSTHTSCDTPPSYDIGSSSSGSSYDSGSCSSNDSGSSYDSGSSDSGSSSCGGCD